MEKDKKKTLTISSSLKKKLDTSSISNDGKKSFSVEKRKLLEAEKTFLRAKSLQSKKQILISKKRILQENLSNNRQQKTLLKKKINIKATIKVIKKKYQKLLQTGAGV